MLLRIFKYIVGVVFNNIISTDFCRLRAIFYNFWLPISASAAGVSMVLRTLVVTLSPQLQSLKFVGRGDATVAA